MTPFYYKGILLNGRYYAEIIDLLNQISAEIRNHTNMRKLISNKVNFRIQNPIRLTEQYIFVLDITPRTETYGIYDCRAHEFVELDYQRFSRLALSKFEQICRNTDKYCAAILRGEKEPVCNLLHDELSTAWHERVMTIQQDSQTDKYNKTADADLLQTQKLKVRSAQGLHDILKSRQYIRSPFREDHDHDDYDER